MLDNALGEDDGITISYSVREDSEREVGFRDCEKVSGTEGERGKGRTHVRFVEALDFSGHGVDAGGAVVRFF